MLRSVLLAWPVAVLLLAAPAAADDNGHDSCPFPDPPASDDDGDDYEESCPLDDDDDDWGFGGGGGGQVADLSWLSIRAAATYSSLDLTNTSLTDPTETVHASGDEVALGDAQLMGVELAFELIPVEPMRLSFGAGMFLPVGGQAGGRMADGRFGNGARSEGVWAFGFFTELGIVQPLGPVQVVAALHLGVQSVNLDVTSDCGCNGHLSGLRAFFGPQVGLRTHVWEWVFLQGAVRFDVTDLPDYVATVSLGLAPIPE